MQTQPHRIDFRTGVSIVIANMVGTGVFTSLGFQLQGIRSGFALLMLWVVGGLVALCGAVSYGELAAALPRSGGEYHYLGRIYHPALGFLSGWISATIAFAAPAALAALALGRYAQGGWPALATPLLTGSSFTGASALAVGVVLVLALANALNARVGSRLQLGITTLKVLVLAAFILAGFGAGSPLAPSFAPGTLGWAELVSPAFAISLVYVSYAYSGWNAATYLTGEIEQPQRNLSRILLAGTAIVLLLYVGLNFVFLYTTPIGWLKGQLEVGYIAANYMFGPAWGRVVGAVIAALLVSTINGMLFAGPRITQVMGEDLPALRWLAVRTPTGIPRRALLLQVAITLVFVLRPSFQAVLVYAGFVLNLFTFLTVLGVFVLRWREPGLPRPYRAWGYPITPLIFLALSAWTLVFLVRDKQQESLYGLATVAAGLLVYFLARRARPAPPSA